MSREIIYRPINRLWALLKPDYAEIRSIYIYAVFAGLISLSLPLGIQAIVNFIQMGEISTSWIILVIFVLGGILLSGLLQIFQLRLTENLQQKIFVRNAFTFANKIPKVDVQSIQRRYAPELMNRFLETASVQKGIAKLVIDFIAASLQIIFGLILLSFYHPFFVLLSFILLVLFFFVFRFLYQRGIQTSLSESRYKFQVQSWLEEMARNIFLFKNHASEEWHLEKTNAITENYLHAREEHFHILKMNYYFLILFKLILIGGLLFLGGYLVIDQKMNMGQFIASEIIIILLMSSIEKIIQTVEVFFDVLTALEKVGEVTDLPNEIQTGLELNNENPIRKIEFVPLVNTIKVDIKNEITFLNSNENEIHLFQSAIGWTNFNLIDVFVNEVNLKEFCIKTYRRRTDYINESPEIFEGTLFENLVLGNPKSDIDRISYALKTSGLENDVKKMSNGLQEKLNPANFPIQSLFTLKLSIARALIDQSDVLFINNDFRLLKKDEAENIVAHLKKQNWKLVIIGNNQYF